MPGMKPESFKQLYTTERFKPLSIIEKASQEYTQTATQKLYNFDPRDGRAGSGRDDEVRESSQEQISTIGSNHKNGDDGIHPSDYLEEEAQKLSDRMRAYDKLTGETNNYPRRSRLDNSPVISSTEANKWEEEGGIRAFRDYVEKYNSTTHNVEEVLKAEQAKMVDSINNGLLGPKGRYDDWQVTPDESSLYEDKW